MGEAGQVLRDSDPSATNTLEKLVHILRNRYGGNRQTDKFRMELRLRRRHANESLSALHKDIRRLMALAHPTLTEDARETIACDYFIDAINDPDFALKVSERAPSTLDDAFRIALQLEAWTKDAQRSKREDDTRARPRAHGAVGDSDHDKSCLEARFERLQADIMRRFDELAKTTQSAVQTDTVPPHKNDRVEKRQRGYSQSGGVSLSAGEATPRTTPATS